MNHDYDIYSRKQTESLFQNRVVMGCDFCIFHAIVSVPA